MVGREIEHNAGLFKPFRQQIQLDYSPKSISISRQNLGTPYSGQVCMHEQRTVCQVQQSLPRPNNFRGGCLFSIRLAGRKQFHKRTLPSSPSYSKQTRSVSGLCHYHSSIVQSSPIFSETDQQINRCSYTASQSTHVLHTNVKHVTRTVKKPKMEDLCLENLWKERLLSRHWSLEAIKSYNCFLAPSSLHTYNAYIADFFTFCLEHDIEISKCKEMPVDAQSHVALYLVKKAQSSERPESLLRTISAALKQFFLAKFGHDPIDSGILRLIQGLIRSNTTRPRERTKIMPVEPFVSLFSKWNDNHILSIACLRQKAITLLALTALCRPSDIAPQAIFRRSQIIQI